MPIIMEKVFKSMETTVQNPNFAFICTALCSEYIRISENPL